jgi:hypothetical protein
LIQTCAISHLLPDLFRQALGLSAHVVQLPEQFGVFVGGEVGHNGADDKAISGLNLSVTAL